MPSPSSSIIRLLLATALPALTLAHVGAFGPGMYCKMGTSGKEENTNTVVNPLHKLSRQDFWFQHDRGCDAAPPPKGEFLELPAGGSFTVQLATDQAFTDISYGGEKVSRWPDGKDHPENWSGEWDDKECLQDGGWMHAQNESMAQGTAFAIAYKSQPKDVTMEDLAVFSVLHHSPWHSSATYQVPKQLEECPEAGCTCAWLWVPQGCGEANMYMQGFKCKVTNVDQSQAKPLAKAKSPAWCKNDKSKCVKGAKSMIVFQQQEPDNVDTPKGEAPVYNQACGFEGGAQDDIFGDGSEKREKTSSSTTLSSATSTSSKSASMSASKTAESSSSKSSMSMSSIAESDVSASSTAAYGTSKSNMSESSTESSMKSGTSESSTSTTISSVFSSSSKPEATPPAYKYSNSTMAEFSDSTSMTDQPTSMPDEPMSMTDEPTLASNRPNSDSEPLPTVVGCPSLAAVTVTVTTTTYVQGGAVPEQGSTQPERPVRPTRSARPTREARPSRAARPARPARPSHDDGYGYRK